MVPIVIYARPAELVRGGETVRGARDRLLDELVHRAPHLVDDFAIASLTGEHTTIMTGVAGKDAPFATLIGQIYSLTYLERETEWERLKAARDTRRGGRG